SSPKVRVYGWDNEPPLFSGRQNMISIKRSCILLSFTMLLATGCASTGGGDVFGDKGITTRVKTAIFNEPELKVMDIHVSTEDRVVKLSGTVETCVERAMAIQVARKVEGVKTVQRGDIGIVLYAVIVT